MKNIVQTIRNDDLPARVVAVVANTETAQAVGWAEQEGIFSCIVPHRDYSTREEFDAVLAQKIESFEPDYVLLAGFMRVLTASFVRRFKGRLINIHPSLLPAFPGLHTHEQALADGVQWHGCTVHFVTDKLDHGPIIAQGTVPVLAGDTPGSLAARVLDIEHEVYANVVRWLAQGRVNLDTDGKVTVRDTRSRAFLGAAERDVDTAP